MITEILSDLEGAAFGKGKRCFDIEIDPSGEEWWIFKQGKGKPPFRVPYKTIEVQLILARKRLATER